jgi:hypothetical protein
MPVVLATSSYTVWRTKTERTRNLDDMMVVAAVAVRSL